MPALDEMWAFVGVPFAACLLIEWVLGYLGTHVLRPEVIFIDIALAEFAAVGMSIAHYGFSEHAHHHGGEGWSAAEYLCAFGMVGLAAVSSPRCGSE